MFINNYQKVVFIMGCLQKIGKGMIAIGDVNDDKNLEKNYNLIKENPQLSKREFLKEMEYDSK